MLFNNEEELLDYVKNNLVIKIGDSFTIDITPLKKLKSKDIKNIAEDIVTTLNKIIPFRVENKSGKYTVRTISDLVIKSISPLTEEKKKKLYIFLEDYYKNEPYPKTLHNLFESGVWRIFEEYDNNVTSNSVYD